jgi:gamma-glutamylputrescine oxidase
MSEQLAADGYIDNHYTRSLRTDLPSAQLIGPVDADACIVGGGISGISTAWELINRGLSVAVLEANRVAWGASGRNGGILSAGFAASDSAIAAHSGQANARALYNLSREGVRIVLDNTRDLNLKGVDPVQGKILASRYPDGAGMRAAQQEAKQQYGHDLEYLPANALRDLVRSDRFHDGLMDNDGYHIQPLNYCVGLAAEVLRKGGQIFERSAMTSMDLTGPVKVVRTAKGTVKSKFVILCGSGYGGAEFGRLRQSILPIATYVVSTRGLGGQAKDIMATRACVTDTRLSCDYFRVTSAGELLWGGGMSALAREPGNLRSLMRARIADVFPQIANIEVELAWTGLMGYASHKMPYLQQLSPNVWTLTALGGHGLNTGPALARVLAESIAEKGRRHELFRPFGLRWNGGVFGPIVADGICAASNLSHRMRERRK